jgi:lysyl endopeptidase
MKLFKFITYLLVLVFSYNFGTSCFAQLSYVGFANDLKLNTDAAPTYYRLEDADQLLRLSHTRNQHAKTGFKISEYAAVVAVNISPESNGTWSSKSDGSAVWLAGFTSKGASSLSITFNLFELLPGSRIIIYSPDRKYIQGAFTFRNSNKSGILAITEIPGDSLVVELKVSTLGKNYGNLNIGSVSVGYPATGPSENSKDRYYGWAADCHVDINCINTPEVQLQKYSTCRLIIERQSSKIRCSGTLINNTSGDGAPYVLTAGHCVSDMYSANRTVFYFDYESPYCDGPDGQIKSISGSELMSRSDNLDFALLKLFEKPPIDYNPLYSGWDATGDGFDTCYSIHHPEGDVKKYTDNFDEVQTGDFEQFDSYTHWLIEKYETGTTENGSSGGALFDSQNRLTGTLTGGGIECTEYIYDYYQKFANCWNDYLAEDQQLQAWLDPSNTGVLKASNLDPYFGTTEKLSNIADDELQENRKHNNWGYVTGHNAEGSIQYAEHYFRNGSKYIYGINLNVAKAADQNPESSIIFKIWEGDEYPQQELFRKEVYTFEMFPGTENFIRFDTLILVDRHFFVGYEISYEQPIDTFALFAAFHSSPDSTNSAIRQINGSWQPLFDGITELNSSLAIYPLVLDYYPPPESEYGNFPFGDITLYPNPTYQNTQVLFKTKIEGELSIIVYDLLGKKISESKVISPEPNFQFESETLPEGMFLLKFEYPGNIYVRKLVKLKQTL